MNITHFGHIKQASKRKKVYEISCKFHFQSNLDFFAGLPSNQLPSVPTEALTRLWKLDRLDLSNNKIHTLDPSSFKVNLFSSNIFIAIKQY